MLGAVSAFADITSFDCDADYDKEELAQFAEVGNAQPTENSTVFINSSGYSKLKYRETILSDDDLNVRMNDNTGEYIVRVKTARGPFAQTVLYVFDSSEGEYYEGTLTLYALGSPLGKHVIATINCFVSED